MHAIKTYYGQCPSCLAVMEGKIQDMLGVNCTELYSDGKMLCDDYLEPQQLVCCPSCSHVFWYSEAAALKTNNIAKESVYPYSSWYLFGTDSSTVEGKIALIHHLEKYLVLLRPLSVTQELHLRKQILWAYNDLIRDHEKFGLKAWLSNRISFRTWRFEQRRISAERNFFMSQKSRYQTNIKRLIEILRSSGDRDGDRVFIAELYRLKGNFEKSIEIIQELRRDTHYAHEIGKRARKGDPLVFQVAG